MVTLGLNGTSSWRMSSGQYGDNSTHIHSLTWKIKRFKLAIDHCYALTYRSEVKTDCTVYRLVPISLAFTMLFSRITTQRSVSAKANLNKKGHCFTWSLSPGNSGATGITLDTKKKPLFTRLTMQVLCQSLLPNWYAFHPSAMTQDGSNRHFYLIIRCVFSDFS